MVALDRPMPPSVIAEVFPAVAAACARVLVGSVDQLAASRIRIG
jgi:hypothetical protein